MARKRHFKVKLKEEDLMPDKKCSLISSQKQPTQVKIPYHLFVQKHTLPCQLAYIL